MILEWLALVPLGVTILGAVTSAAFMPFVLWMRNGTPRTENFHTFTVLATLGLALISNLWIGSEVQPVLSSTGVAVKLWG